MQLLRRHGSDPGEIVRVMMAMVRTPLADGRRPQWVCKNGRTYYELRNSICGVKMVLRELCVGRQIGLTGARGWAVDFFISEFRSRNADPSELHDYDVPTTKGVQHRYLSLCDVKNPEAFRHDMTLLRLFDTEWRT